VGFLIKRSNPIPIRKEILSTKNRLGSETMVKRIPAKKGPIIHANCPDVAKIVLILTRRFDGKSMGIN
jgi:hypothetical protein